MLLDSTLTVAKIRLLTYGVLYHYVIAIGILPAFFVAKHFSASR